MCEDDSLLWADNVKTMFDATYKYISVCAKGALISTKKKFIFSQDEVEFVGFKISKDAIISTDSKTARIQNFPQAKIFLMQGLSLGCGGSQHCFF